MTILSTATENSIDKKKAFYINKMFSKIAKNYDLLNNLMTFGLHNVWKEEAIRYACKEGTDLKNALDLCCGTADLGLMLSKKLPPLNIKCVDNSLEMLSVAEERLNKEGINNIKLIQMDCEDLEFTSGSYDLLTIGFGLRNLIQREKFLQDAYTLLKPKGVFACIDLGYPSNYFWRSIYFFYFFHIVPRLGQAFAGDKEAYNYLPNSLSTWYKQEELKNLILQTGFEKCYFKNILGGAVAIHIAVK